MTEYLQNILRLRVNAEINPSEIEVMSFRMNEGRVEQIKEIEQLMKAIIEMHTEALETAAKHGKVLSDQANVMFSLLQNPAQGSRLTLGQRRNIFIFLTLLITTQENLLKLERTLNQKLGLYKKEYADLCARNPQLCSLEAIQLDIRCDQSGLPKAVGAFSDGLRPPRMSQQAASQTTESKSGLSLSRSAQVTSVSTVRSELSLSSSNQQTVSQYQDTQVLAEPTKRARTGEMELSLSQYAINLFFGRETPVSASGDTLPEPFFGLTGSEAEADGFSLGSYKK